MKKLIRKETVQF